MTRFALSTPATSPEPIVSYTTSPTTVTRPSAPKTQTQDDAARRTHLHLVAHVADGPEDALLGCLARRRRLRALHARLVRLLRRAPNALPSIPVDITSRDDDKTRSRAGTPYLSSIADRRGSRDTLSKGSCWLTMKLPT
jgi:hypothetical protein